jgi:hypothetical protein
VGGYEPGDPDRLGFGAFPGQTLLVQRDVDQEGHRGDHCEQDQNEDPYPQRRWCQLHHQEKRVLGFETWKTTGAAPTHAVSPLTPYASDERPRG